MMTSTVASSGEGASSSKALVNGVQLHYEMRGTGPHPIVCIPGAMGTAKNDFEPQLDYFGREGSGYTVVSFDPRGFGLSRPAERFKKGSNYFQADAKDAHALMQHLSLSKYSVLGFSDGGMAGLILASMHPESVRKLVVFGSNALFTEDDISTLKHIRDLGAWSAEMRAPYEKEYGDSLQELLSTWVDMTVEFYEDNNGDICVNELPKIACPTLIVHGKKDPLVALSHAEFLRDHVQGSHLEVIAEGEHYTHLKHHQEFNKMVDQFLE